MFQRLRKWREQIPVFIIPATLVAVLCLGMFVFQKQNAINAREQAYAALADSAEEQIQTINAAINGQFTALETFSALLGADDADSEELLRRMRTVENVSGFTNISYIKADGLGVSSAGSFFRAEDRPYFIAAMQEGRGVQYIASGRIASTPHIGLAVPVYRGGVRVGVLLAIYSESQLRAQINTHVYGDSGYSFVCDGEGNVIISTDATNFLLGGDNVLNKVYEADIHDGFSAETLAKDFAEHRAGSVAYTYGGQARYAVYRPLEIGDWMLFNAIPSAVVATRERQIMRSGWITTGTTAAAAMLLLLYILIREQRSKNRLEREKELFRRSEDLYRAIENLSDGILFDADVADGKVRFNSNYVIELGRVPNIHTFDDLPRARANILEEDWPRWDGCLASLFSGKETPPVEIRILTREKTPVWYRIECKTLRDADGKPYRVVGKLINIDAQVRSIKRLQSRAENDSLTGLFNHETTRLKISEALAASDEGSVHALLILDLDNFKNVNDQFGHFEGDRTLIQLANGLRRLFRSSDIIGRIGGDEFIVFLPNAGSERLAEEKAAELCETMQFTYASGERETVVTCSVGVAIVIGGTIRFDELYQRADHALYEAKEQGKARYVAVHAGEVLPEDAPGTRLQEVPHEGNAIIQLRALLEHMDGGVMLFELQPEHIYAIYISPSYYKISGSEPTAFSATRDIASVVHPDDVRLFADSLRSGAEDGNVVDVVYRTIRTDGGLGWRHLRAVLIPYEESAFPVMIGVITDVTELRESALRLRAILDSAPCGIGTLEVGTRIRVPFASDGMLDLFHCTREEFGLYVQGDFCQFVFPEDLEPFRAELDRALAADAPFGCFLRILPFSDGKPRWALLRGKQVGEKDGVPACLVTIMDVDRQKRMERELAMSNELITLAFSQTNALVWEYEFAEKRLTVHDLQNGGFDEGETFESMPDGFLDDGRVHAVSLREFAELADAVQRGEHEGKAHLLLRMGRRFRWNRVSFRTIFGDDALPLRAVGVSIPTSSNAYSLRPSGSETRHS